MQQKLPSHPDCQKLEPWMQLPTWYFFLGVSEEHFPSPSQAWSFCCVPPLSEGIPTSQKPQQDSGSLSACLSHCQLISIWSPNHPLNPLHFHPAQVHQPSCANYSACILSHLLQVSSTLQLEWFFFSSECQSHHIPSPLSNLSIASACSWDKNEDTNVAH